MLQDIGTCLWMRIYTSTDCLNVESVRISSMAEDKHEFFGKLSLLMREYGVASMPVTKIAFNDMHVWSIAYNHGLTVTPTNHNTERTMKPVEEYA